MSANSNNLNAAPLPAYHRIAGADTPTGVDTGEKDHLVKTSSVRQRVFRLRADDRLPIRIEHQRIYILPTRRGWAFLGSLLLMLVASVNYSLSLGYALCFLLTGLFSATLLNTYRNLAGLEVSTIDTDTCFAGSPLPFSISMRNATSLARHGIRLRTRGSRNRDGAQATEARTGIAADSSAELVLDIPTRVRGAHPLGRLTIDSDWPLGLWNAWSYVHTPSRGLVYPTPEHEPPPLPSTTAPAEGGAHQRGNRGDVAGLRPYVPGDVPSTFAWKSLARGQGLHVRVFEDERQQAFTRLTLASTGLADDEARLARLSAWVLAAEASGTDYALDLPGTRLDSDRGPAQREAALAALALYGTPDS